DETAAQHAGRAEQPDHHAAHDEADVVEDVDLGHHGVGVTRGELAGRGERQRRDDPEPQPEDREPDDRDPGLLGQDDEQQARRAHDTTGPDDHRGPPAAYGVVAD